MKKADGTRFDLDATRLAGDRHRRCSPATRRRSAACGRCKPFDPSKGQWGALELAARVHELELGARDASTPGLVDPTKSARKLTAWAVGLNWSLTRNIKQYADFEHVTFKGGAAGGADREAENVFFIRTQVSF